NAPAAARLHALAALAGLDRAGVEGLDDDVIARALDDSDPSVRRFAIELCENRLPPPDILAAALLARVEESSPRVALQLALTLGDWSDARAGEALGDLALRWHEDPGMLDALKSSARHHAEAIVRTILGAKDANRIDTGGRDRLLTRFVPDLVRRAKDRPDALASTIDELGRRCEKGEGGHEALAALLRALRRDRELRSILSGDLETRLVAVGRSARAQALGDASDEMRVQAIGLVAEIAASHRDDHERAAELEALASLLDPRESFAVRRATVSALERSGATADAASILLDAWRSSTPPIRAAILDATIARGDSAALLLDRIEAGTILPREIDPARRRRLLEHARADLRERARALIAAGDASESERAKTIERLLPAASAGGDASRGIAVFEERCATCHRLAGRGHAVGPDLETVSGRSPEALLVDLVDPNRAVEDRFTAYAVVTNDGRALSGIVVEETSVALTLLGQDGRREVVPRVEIAVLESSGASLMPEGLEAELSPEDVASLIAAIRARRAPPKEFPGNEPGIVRAGANGDLDLRASRAEIRGPSLVFEPRFGNLGFWGSPEDFALWRIEAPRAGVYEVSLLFACPENEAGDEIAVETGSGRVVGTIGATASWDDYREASIGRIELGEGAQEVIVRSSGPIRGYLVDLQAVRLNPVE
ncbi:MAG TPA: c-type cytochrome, partial [Planctomycetota bacterium]|nr:c-type cytochrome [Planctomycetota bacterium]